MPNFFNKYPYTDFHELNLDWVLETMKNLVQEWEAYHTTLSGEWDDMQEEWHDTEEAWISLHDYVENFFNNLDVQQEVNVKIDQMVADGTMDQLLLPLFTPYTASINQMISDQNDAIGVLTNRVDEITNLPVGSTAGDAELADIRVPAAGFNRGNNYNDAGNAVRGQVGELMGYRDISDGLSMNVYNIDNYGRFNLGTFLQGYYDNGQFYPDASQITTNYLKLPAGYVRIRTTGTFQMVYNEYEYGASGWTRVTHSTNAKEILFKHADESHLVTIGLYGAGVLPSNGSELDIIFWNEQNIIRKNEVERMLAANGYISLKGVFKGSYNTDASISTNSLQASYCGLVEVPADCFVLAKTRVTGTTMYLRSYTYSGGVYTRVGNSSLGSIAANIATGDRFYSFLINKSSTLQDFTDDEYDFLIVDKNQMCYYSQNNTTLHLLWNKTDYTIFKQNDGGRNLLSWRFYRAISESTELWSDSDAEGPVKLVGDSDFISGYHGNEQLSDATIFIDQTELDMSDSSVGIANIFELYQTSTVYRTDGVTPAFTRDKKVTIINGEYDVQQTWHALINCTIDRGALCLFQSPKTYMHGWDTPIWLPRHDNDGSTSLYGADAGSMYIGTRKFTLQAEYGQQFAGYHASVTDFTSRLKFYFDMYNGKSLSAGDEIKSKFKVTINKV